MTYKLSTYNLENVGLAGVQPHRIHLAVLTDSYKHMKETGLPIILDDYMLSDILSLKRQTLYWAGNPYCQAGGAKGFQNSEKSLYRVFSMKKGVDRKTGKVKFREIQAPKKHLKYIQTQITKQILDKVSLPDYITGFRKGKGIKQTADVHASKNIVVSLDLQNYFNSITQKHLMKVFGGMFRYPEKVSKLLSEICTYKFFVPQGAPSSPALSNIVGYYLFDEKILEIATKYGFTITRYADDITLSTDKDYPKTEVEKEDGTKIISSEIDTMIKEIESVLNAEGFRLNRRKTKVMREGSRKWAMGTVINNKPTLLRTKRNLLKCIVHNIMINGVGPESKKTERTEHQFTSWVRGMIAHFQQIDPDRGNALSQEFEAALKMSGYQEDIKEIEIKI